MQGLNAVEEKQFDKVLEYFKLSGEQAKEPLCKNPFAAYWNDWTTAAPLPQDDSIRMSRIAIAKELISYNEQAVKKQASSAEAYYRLGNFYFNIFKYGPSWQFSETSGEKYLNITRYYEPQVAQKNFELALANSPSSELKAKIYAMSAKCSFYPQFHMEDRIKERFQSCEEYEKLKEECSKTKFYAEMIKECGYFRMYLGKRE